MTGNRSATPDQRTASKRTAWIVAAIAAAVYGAFMLSGMLGL